MMHDDINYIFFNNANTGMPMAYCQIQDVSMQLILVIWKLYDDDLIKVKIRLIHLLR